MKKISKLFDIYWKCPKDVPIFLNYYIWKVGFSCEFCTVFGLVASVFICKIVEKKLRLSRRFAYAISKKWRPLKPGFTDHSSMHFLSFLEPHNGDKNVVKSNSIHKSIPQNVLFVFIYRRSTFASRDLF